MGVHKCEAHNWVIDEEGCPVCEGMEIIRKRVRELHTWITTTSVYDPDHKKICAECSQYHDCEEWGLTTGKSVLVKVEYPCPTIKALEGETE